MISIPFQVFSSLFCISIPFKELTHRIIRNSSKNRDLVTSLYPLRRHIINPKCLWIKILRKLQEYVSAYSRHSACNYSLSRDPSLNLQALLNILLFFELTPSIPPSGIEFRDKQKDCGHNNYFQMLLFTSPPILPGTLLPPKTAGFKFLILLLSCHLY